jgi:hypothetical protein
VSDYKDKSLKDFEKEWKRGERQRVWLKVKNAINILPQQSATPSELKDPDISTITEHIAFVIDDKIVEIMHCQPKLAAILLSEPKIIKIEDGQFPKPGWLYEDGKFISPSGQQTDNVSQAEEDSLATFREYIETDGSPLPTFKEYIESNS